MFSQLWYRSSVHQTLRIIPIKHGPGKNVLYLPSRVAAPDHKYIRSSPIGWTKNCHSDISLTPSLNQSSNKCQIWPFSTQSNLRRSEFETKQDIWNLKGAVRAFNWSLSFPNLILVASQTLRTVAQNCPPPEKRAGKLIQSPIIQLCIVRLCWKLIHWCIYGSRRSWICANPMQIQDVWRRPNWTYLNRNRLNTAMNCSLSLKFNAEFDHASADTL